MSLPSYDGYDSTGIEHYSIPSFKFISGASLDVRISYRSFNPSGGKVVVIPTCYGGRINDTLNFTGENGVLAACHVIVVAMLGNGESSSPSNEPEFPKSLDYRDCISSQYELLTKHLGIKELEAVIGFSMGGQQAYHWACMYPQFMKYVVPICGSAKTSVHNYAFVEGPKAALINSIDYQDGAYRSKGTKPSRGLRAFGRTYCPWALSAAWFREGCYQDVGYKEVEQFIQAEWEDKFEKAWDAEDMLILARMWQAGDIGKTQQDGDYLKALQAIEAKVLVMPARTDTYFPPEDSENEVKYLKHGELAVIETIWGHMAGGGANPKDTKWMNDRIALFMNSKALDLSAMKEAMDK
ncbi:MAG: hypothetical protein L6R37_003186 [Teloschistes peruensis]|nr:MAG: hypothetical protein L6R37_003186 [Teloschistes peruensis]